MDACRFRRDRGSGRRPTSRGSRSTGPGRRSIDPQQPFASILMTAFESDDPASVRIGFIGAGRLGCALAWSFAERGLSVNAVASLLPADAAKLASRVPGCRIFGD